MSHIESEIYRNLPPAARALYRDFVDILMQMRLAEITDADAQQLAIEKAGWTVDDFQSAWPSVKESDFLVEVFSPVKMDFVVSFPDVAAELRQRAAQEEISRRLKRSKTAKEKRTTIKGQNAIETGEALIGFVDDAEDHESYTGWLYTRKTSETGQVYRITGDVVTDLKQRFPAKNIEDELQAIFSWLKRNPHKRKRAAFMNNFIYEWMSELTLSEPVEEQSLDDILAEIVA